ncbi:MAG: hypothetical protein SGJ11_08455 [Phycisphaerae bacterium]|nr:hypothetical protein [Phycisphaerae bacterium]
MKESSYEVCSAITRGDWIRVDRGNRWPDELRRHAEAQAAGASYYEGARSAGAAVIEWYDANCVHGSAADLANRCDDAKRGFHRRK